MVGILILLAQISFAATHFNNASVYFNQDPKVKYLDPYRGFEKHGDNFEATIISEINKSQTSIKIAVQELRLPLISKALVEKAKAGIKIQLILENQYSTPYSDLTPDQVGEMTEHERARYNEFIRLVDMNQDGTISPEEINERDALVILRNNQLPWIDDTSDGSRGSGLMHHKFLIIDEKVLIVTSANFTMSDMHGDFGNVKTLGNANAMIIFRDPVLISSFSQEFSELWNHKYGLKKSFRGARKISTTLGAMTLQFSPTSKKYGFEASTNGLITSHVSQATKSAHLALFVFSEQKISDAMSGIGDVKTLIDSLFATRYYSELLDMFGLQMKTPKCIYEPLNNPWKKPQFTGGIPRFQTGDMLHHKFAVVDGKKLLFGSHNWSASANEQNDETFMVIEHEGIAQLFEEEFARIYSNSSLGIQPWILQKIADVDRSCI